MESDHDFRARVFLILCNLPTIGAALDTYKVMHLAGKDLDELATKYGMMRFNPDMTHPLDPFGDKLGEALRREDEVIPHPVTRPETEAEKEALWASIESYGKGS